LARAEVYGDRVAVSVTSESLAEELSLLIAESMTVIEIDRSCTLLAGIYP
jgi:hypothetical protein